MKEKRVIIIAGPNGAGKTTFELEYLLNKASCPVFVNAYLIAAGTSPFRHELVALKKGRLMLNEITAHTSRRTDFAFESLDLQLLSSHVRLSSLSNTDGQRLSAMFAIDTILCSALDFFL